MDDITHNIISLERCRYWCETALALIDKPSKALNISKEAELRKCQINALENIEYGRMNKIKLACGSGKTRIAAEVIKRKCGRYLVLVPYLILLEQWYTWNYNVRIVRIGTGYDEEIGQVAMNETVVVICVYNSYEKA